MNALPITPLKIAQYVWATTSRVLSSLTLTCMNFSSVFAQSLAAGATLDIRPGIAGRFRQGLGYATAGAAGGCDVCVYNGTTLYVQTTQAANSKFALTIEGDVNNGKALRNNDVVNTVTYYLNCFDWQ